MPRGYKGPEMLKLDHIAVGCTDLAAGTAYVASGLGVQPQPGGKHAHFGTHNTLLGLGPDLYLEVIALDPAAPPTGRPAWFGLDHFRGPPRLCNWICAVDDFTAAGAAMPADPGAITPLSRNALRWEITVPADGSLPMDGAQPTLIAWGAGVTPPATDLPDTGCRLTMWEVIHPDANMLSRSIPLKDPRVRFTHGAQPSFRATFATPEGDRVLT